MLLAFNIHYSACGHCGQTEYRLLSSLQAVSNPDEDHDVVSMEVIIAEGKFCPGCFVKSVPWALAPPRPDPWRIPFHGLTFGLRELQESEILFRNAEGLFKKAGNDLLSFIGSGYVMMNTQALEALTRVEWLLASNVLWRIAHPEKPQPTKAQRNFVLQLGTVLDFDIILRKWMKKKCNCDRRALLRALVPKVNRLPEAEDLSKQSKEDGPKEDQSCTICGEHLLDLQSSGKGEPCVRTSCGHLFGEDCLFTWLEKNATCPNCRCVILPITENRETLHVLYAAADTRPTPSWLTTIIGCDPEAVRREIVLHVSSAPINAFLQNLDLLLLIFGFPLIPRGRRGEDDDGPPAVPILLAENIFFTLQGEDDELDDDEQRLIDFRNLPFDRQHHQGEEEELD